MFSTIKGYLYAAGAAIIMILAAVFKYRGMKIDNLEAEVKTAEHNAIVVEKAMEAERKVSTFEADNRVEATKAEIEVHKEEFLETHDEDPSRKFYSI